MKYCLPMRVQVMLTSKNISEGIEMPEGPRIGDYLFDILGKEFVCVYARRWIRDDHGWLLIVDVN